MNVVIIYKRLLKRTIQNLNGKVLSKIFLSQQKNGVVVDINDKLAPLILINAMTFLLG